MHIINYKTLEEMFLGKTDKVELLIDALKERLPEWLTEVEEAQASKDAEATRNICHRIRGAAGTITAEKLENAAMKLGDIAKENRPEEITTGYENLIMAINELDDYTKND